MYAAGAEAAGPEAVGGIRSVEKLEGLGFPELPGEGNWAVAKTSAGPPSTAASGEHAAASEGTRTAGAAGGDHGACWERFEGCRLPAEA